MLAAFLFCLYLILVSVLFFGNRNQWWIKIDTQTPACTYYFGPFPSRQEAAVHQEGYLQDLYNEGATGISVSIERGCPKTLTIFEEERPLSSI